MTRNTRGSDVGRALVHVERDRSEQLPSLMRSVPSRVLHAGLVAAALFFVAFATTDDAQPLAQARTQAVRPHATAVRAPKAAVSPQYQAKNTDIGAGASRRPGGSTADMRSKSSIPAVWLSEPFYRRGAVPTSQSPAPRKAVALHRLPTWYQAAYSQYRLPGEITEPDLGSVRSAFGVIASELPLLIRSTPSHIRPVIDSQSGSDNFSSPVIPARQSLSEPQAHAADKKRLLQLGLALGLAYVVFLAGWFWKTRGGRHGIGRVVRF